MHVCMHTCVYTYVCMHTSVYICMNVYVCIHICTYIYMYIRMYACMCTCMQVCMYVTYRKSILGKVISQDITLGRSPVSVCWDSLLTWEELDLSCHKQWLHHGRGHLYYRAQDHGDLFKKWGHELAGWPGLWEHQEINVWFALFSLLLPLLSKKFSPERVSHNPQWPQTPYATMDKLKLFLFLDLLICVVHTYTQYICCVLSACPSAHLKRKLDPIQV